MIERIDFYKKIIQQINNDIQDAEFKKDFSKVALLESKKLDMKKRIEELKKNN